MEPIDFAELSHRVDTLLRRIQHGDTSYLVECDCWNHRQGDDVYRFVIYVALPGGLRVEASTFEVAFHLLQRELISRIGLVS